jgi:hypothetical protein
VKFLSGGLAEVREQEGEQVVQLIHQSALDFVVNVKQQENCAVGASVAGLAHSWLSACCLRYLCKVIDTVEPEKLVWWTEIPGEADHPFLQYSWRSWIRHAQGAEAEDCALHVIFPLLHSLPGRILPWLPGACFILFRFHYPTLLHVASVAGLLSIFKRLLSSGDDLRDRALHDRGSALTLAAKEGHTAVVKLLLEHRDLIYPEGANLRGPMRAALGAARMQTVQFLMRYICAPTIYVRQAVESRAYNENVCVRIGDK